MGIMGIMGDMGRIGKIIVNSESPPLTPLTTFFSAQYFDYKTFPLFQGAETGGV